MSGNAFVAIDLGASSGRVILGWMCGSGPELEILHRFSNGPVEVEGSLRWDIRGLFAEILDGLRLAADRARVRDLRIISIGVDTWAVDYGLIDDGGKLASLPFSYRDDRTTRAVDLVHGVAPFERLYSTTGMQFLPFNTIYQLATEPSFSETQALLIPDLLGYWLTGNRVCEETNASTTGLLDALTGEWATELFDALGLPRDLFPRVVPPGTAVGQLLPAVVEQTGLPAATTVVTVGSHDTASAVCAVPAASPAFAYISSGTWSLVGVELTGPILTDVGRSANFTNERGVDGTVRYLRNVGGLWVLQESMRTWREEGLEPQLEILLHEAGQLPAGGPMVDVDSPSFIAPGNMPTRIQQAIEQEAGPSGPMEPASVVRCILDSLAYAYARTVRQAVELADHPVDVIHIVGGGSQNQLLCQLTADATGLPVLAGPIEGTALGNIMVQARAAGDLGEGASLLDIRAAVRETAAIVRYQPAADDAFGNADRSMDGTLSAPQR